MTKQQQFLFIVQTAILSNSVNISSIESKADKYRHVISASGVMAVAAEAIDASANIPEDMTAGEAADEFCTWMLDNLRDIEEAAGSKLSVPNWFARG